MKTVKLFLTPDFKSLMNVKGWTVAILSKELRYHKSQIYQIINGKIEPSLAFLRRLADFTGLDFQNLVITQRGNREKND